METIDGDLYDYPVYYDLVFGSDWQAEFDFLQDCFQEYSTAPVQRVFEPACGTGRLLYRLAKEDYEVSGLDLNPKAVAYCNQRLRRHGLPESAFVGDMCDFHLPGKVDAAFNMINSFRHLVRQEQAIDHLKAMARAVRKGGLYLLGLHLTPTTVEPTEEESWSARRGNLCVNTHLKTMARDPRTRRETFRMRYDVYTPTQSFRIASQIEFRTYTARQFRNLLNQSGGWQIVDQYDFSYDIESPIRITPSSEDVVFVLRRT